MLYAVTEVKYGVICCDTGLICCDEGQIWYTCNMLSNGVIIF